MRCTSIPAVVSVDILKIKACPKTRNTILVRLPSCEWWRPEALLDDEYRKLNTDTPTKCICIWLEVLQDSIEALDLPTATDLIVVRTNVWKLDEAVKRDLYVKSDLGVYIAGTIHRLLSRQSDRSNNEKQTFPVELRSVLVKGGIPHPLN